MYRYSEILLKFKICILLLKSAFLHFKKICIMIHLLQFFQKIFFSKFAELFSRRFIKSRRIVFENIEHFAAIIYSLRFVTSKFIRKVR